VNPDAFNPGRPNIAAAGVVGRAVADLGRNDLR